MNRMACLAPSMSIIHHHHPPSSIIIHHHPSSVIMIISPPSRQADPRATDVVPCWRLKAHAHTRTPVGLCVQRMQNDMKCTLV